MVTDLSGRTIALTGAGSGIGRALAQLLAVKGVRLALADKDAPGLAETRALLGNAHATTTVLDVTDDAALKDWIDTAAREFGGLDGIINNAGLTVVAPFADTPAADFDRVMAVNFGGVVAGCRHALPHLRQRDAPSRLRERDAQSRLRERDAQSRLRERDAQSRLRERDAAWLVNISSVFGMMGYPTQSAYNASKFAVRGLTEALYLELGQTDPHIRVIRVHPGGIKTNVARNAKQIARMPGVATFDTADAFEKAARTTPAQAAATIVDGMERGLQRVLIGSDAKLIDLVTRLFPVTYFKRIGMFLGGS